MPQITVRDLSGNDEVREVPEGTTAGEVYTDRAVVVARVNGELRDLSYIVSDGDVVEPVAVDSEDGRAVLRHSTAHVLAQAVQELFPEAKLGIGPPIENGFYYDFDVETPVHPRGPQGAREADAARSSRRGQRFSRRVVTEDEARAELAHEPYKLRAHRPQGRSAADATERRDGGRRRRAHHLRQPRRARPASARWGDLCRGPHVPTTRADPGVQADALGRRVLARQREEPAAAAHLRHRVAEPRRAQGAPRVPRGGRAARPPPARRRARPVLASPTRSAPASRCSTPRAASSAGRWRTTRGCATRRPATSSSTPRTSPRRALFEISGHLDWYAEGMYPPMELDAEYGADGEVTQAGAEVLHEADELPDAQPDLRRARPVVPRAAAAAVRVRHRLPLREVRRRARPDPRARLHPGRRAHLLHHASRWPASSTRCSPSCSTCCATTASTTSTSSCRPATRRSRSAPTRCGRRPPRPCAQAARAPEPRARPRPGGRGVLRPEDLGAGQGRDRPHLADVDDPGRLQPAGAVRPRVPGAPTARASVR